MEVPKSQLEAREWTPADQTALSNSLGLCTGYVLRIKETRTGKTFAKDKLKGVFPADLGPLHDKYKTPTGLKATPSNKPKPSSPY